MLKDLEYQEIYSDQEERWETKRGKNPRKPRINSAADEDIIPNGNLAKHFSVVDLPTTTQLMTDTLRNRLQGIGITDPVILARANIYQHALLNLSHILSSTPLPEQLRQESTQELGVLAQTLEMLFSRQIHLIIKTEDYGSTSFEGYFSLPNGEPRRVSIHQRFRDSYSQTFQRPARIGCQIQTNPIQGITTRKRLVAAAKEAGLRCGLRYGRDDNRDTYWGVSIDSGLCPDKSPLSCQRWLSVFPLSQAIRTAKDNPLSGLSRLDGDYTFHYQDPDTGQPDWESVIKLKLFNEGLHEIFRGMAKSHISRAFSRNLEIV